MRFFSVLLLTLLIIVTVLSCSSDVTEAVAVGDFSKLLEEADSSGSIPLAKIKKLDPYDSYFLALKASELGYYDAAVRLARHCWKNSGGFIGERAAELSIRLHMEGRDYKEAEFLASLASAEFPDNYAFRRAVAEAEYWQKDDKAVLETLSELEKQDEAVTDGELKLFRAVSAFRAGTDGWKDEWFSLFKLTAEPDYIRRGWDYITTISDISYKDFSPEEDLFTARYAHAVGKYTEAAAAYRSYLARVQPEYVSSAVIGDIEDLYLRSGLRLAGARLLEDSGAEFLEFQFAAARLYRRAGRYADADRCMERVLLMSNDEYPDRVLWYSLDIKVRRNLSDAVDSLDFYIQHWENPDYFSDSLNNLCTSLAGRRDWGRVTELALKLEERGPSKVYDRCRYISSRASDLGWTSKAAFERGYSELYYRLLAGQDLVLNYSLSDQQRLESACTDPPEPLNEYEKYIMGLLEYRNEGITDEVKKYSEEFSEEFLSYCAAESAAAGNHLESIRIMYQFSGQYSLNGYRALYPDLYLEEIEAAAAENDIPPQLMFALVWKESGFENDIVSRSGAVGLSQLMPATADDVAGRKGRAAGDLTDPAENLELGAWYLNWLKGYVGNTALAVLSYNGGPGRVKGWQRVWSGLPDDLFYEVIPVAETHNYGKKVLEAAVIYGILYYGTDADETLKLFF